MRIGVLVLAILGSLIALALGACTGACVSTLGGVFGTTAEGMAAGATLMMCGVIQSVLGLVGGVMVFRALGAGGKAKVGSILLFVGAAVSLIPGSALPVLTGGTLHLIAGIMALVAKGGGPAAAAGAGGE